MATSNLSTSELAYLRLLNAPKEASEIITGPLGAVNARERAEGFRHLTRLLSAGLEQCLEKGDRARPEFVAVDGVLGLSLPHRDPRQTTGLTHLSVNVRALCPEVDELDVRFLREKLGDERESAGEERWV